MGVHIKKFTRCPWQPWGPCSSPVGSPRALLLLPQTPHALVCNLRPDAEQAACLQNPRHCPPRCPPSWVGEGSLVIGFTSWLDQLSQRSSDVPWEATSE